MHALRRHVVCLYEGSRSSKCQNAVFSLALCRADGGAALNLGAIAADQEQLLSLVDCLTQTNPTILLHHLNLSHTKVRR